MKENKEVTKSLMDALMEIHKELAADEAFLSGKMRGAESDPDEEKMRIQHVLSLAVMMEEAIDSVLKELRQEKADAEAKADFNVPELHHLEYDTHVIGMPDEENGNSVMEDIALDKDPAAEEEAERRVDDAVELADEIADEAEEAAKGEKAGDASPEEPAESGTPAAELPEDAQKRAALAVTEEDEKKAAEEKKKAEKKAKKEAKEKEKKAKKEKEKAEKKAKKEKEKREKKEKKEKDKKKKEKKSKKDEDDD